MKREIITTFEGEEILRLIGQNVKTARLRRNESETMLAERLGVSRATIARLEAGNGGVALGLAVEALLSYGFADQLFALGHPDVDGVGKRLDRLRTPVRGNGRAVQPRQTSGIRPGTKS